MATQNEKFIQAIGRRKTSVASARLTKADNLTVVINGKTLSEYFPIIELREKVLAPLKAVQMENSVDLSIKVRGGGINSQAEAIAHAIGRAIIKYDSELRKTVKKAGHLKRDQRMKERRKFGLKKARKSPQWSKR